MSKNLKKALKSVKTNVDNFLTAARLQNEIAPEIVYIDAKNGLKIAKKDPNRVQKM